MKNKKTYLIIGILIFLGITTIIIWNINRQNNNTNSNEWSKNGQENNKETSSRKIPLKKSSNNSIKKDDIEVTNIEIINNTNDLQVKTTLKNHTSDKVEGFFIEIDLLDKSGNVVTSIAENSQETIEVNGELTLTNYVVEFADASKVVNAQIVSIEKDNSKTIEDSFDTIEEEVRKDIEGE